MEQAFFKSSRAQGGTLPTRKTTILAAILSVSTLAFSAAAQAEYKQITRLGTNQAVCKPGVHSGDELQAFFRNQPQDVIDILNSGSWDGDANDLFNAVEAGSFSERSIAPGTQLQWMGFRQKGQIVAEPREWAGKESFEAFEVSVVSNCKTHQIIVPKVCCNVSFMSASEITTASPTIQVSQSGEGGAVVSVSVESTDGSPVTTELTHPNGTTEQLNLSDGQWQGTLPPGDYMLTARAENECGDASAKQMITVAAAPVAMAAAPTGGLYYAPFIGRQVRNIDPPLVGIDVGYAHPVADKIDLFVQGGVSYNTDDERTSVYIDVGADRKVGKTGFIGAGVGAWDINDSDFSDETFFIHGGADTPWVVSGNNVQWFVEGRIFADHTDDISNHNILKAGLRFKQ